MRLVVTEIHILNYLITVFPLELSTVPQFSEVCLYTQLSNLNLSQFSSLNEVITGPKPSASSAITDLRWGPVQPIENNFRDQSP